MAFLQERGLLEDGASTDRVLRAALRYLAGGPGRMVVATLEDLWGETLPQNVPGTTDEHPNWRRRARHSLEELTALPEVVEPLREMDRLRKDGDRP